MRIPFGRGMAAGLAGTTVMTLSLTAEQRLRRRLNPHLDGFVDYDASPHVVTAASAVLHWQPETDVQREGLFLVVHWGYGSAVGAGYEALRRLGVGRRAATWIFYAGCQTMAMTLFPTAGGTPPPWRWRPSLLASSLIQHAIYAASVATVSERLFKSVNSDIENLDNGRFALGTVET